MIAEGVTCKGLLDSGSQVTTVAEWFYKQFLQNSDLITVDELLDLKQVSGHQLDYSGIIAVDSKFPELDNDKICSTPVIGIKDTNFNQEVPFLLGTNVFKSCLSYLQEKAGPSFIQKARVGTPWKLAFQCVLNEDKKSIDKMGHVLSTKQVVTVKGLTRVSCPSKTMVVTEPDCFRMLPVGLTLLPSFQEIDSNHRITVHIRNLTSQQIIIPSKAVICQLQKAEIVNPSDCETPSPEHSFLQWFKLNSKLSSSELCQIKELLLKWKHLFSTSNTDIGRTDKVEHHIVLTNNEPFKERYTLRCIKRYSVSGTRGSKASYCFCRLTPAESRYPAHKLEFLALKWSVTEMLMVLEISYNVMLFVSSYNKECEEMCKEIKLSRQKLNICLYAKLNFDTNIKQYSQLNTNKEKRNIITKFRTRTHGLQIEIDQYKSPSIPYSKRKCSQCNDINDEIHMLLYCK